MTSTNLAVFAAVALPDPHPLDVMFTMAGSHNGGTYESSLGPIIPYLDPHRRESSLTSVSDSTPLPTSLSGRYVCPNCHWYTDDLSAYNYHITSCGDGKHGDAFGTGTSDILLRKRGAYAYARSNVVFQEPE